MDYEQKYKAALEWMQGMYGGLHGKTKEEAEKYFPELKEPKDEWIRKWLIRYFEQKSDNNVIFADISLRDILAWLEKQVEKPQGKTALEAIMEEKSPTESLGISPEKYEEIVNECIYGEAIPEFKVGDWVVDKEDDDKEAL